MRLPQNNQGFVSLFTSIMLSLLLLVITVSVISLEALQLRKAEDAEQTLRAYYAAEAGVEDAVSKVLSSSRVAQDCSDPAKSRNDNFDVPGAAGWTCQQITYSGQPFGKLEERDVAKTVDPGDVNPKFQSVVIEWGDSTNQLFPPYYVPFTGNRVPSQAEYTSNACLGGVACAVAPIELSIVEYPPGGFSASQVCDNAAPGCVVKSQNVVVWPGGTTASGVVDYNSIYHSTVRFREGNCRPTPRFLPSPTGGVDYNCYVILENLPPASDYIFRIRSRYLPSAYKMTFKSGTDGNGATIDVPDGTATIDVTAKAGETYRRVISKLPFGGGGAGRLNYVMYSDTTICKGFDVINNAAQANGCPYN